MWLPLVLVSSMLLSFVSGASPIPKDGRIDIWPQIPFVRGADLCRFSDAYGQTRTQYMDGMLKRAQDLMMSGARPKEALQLLSEINSLYDRNQEMALKNNYLDVTLEASLKAYIDGYYRDLAPKTKNISFQHLSDIISIVRANQRGQRDVILTEDSLAKIDYFAFGTYALAPNCQGEIQVTLHLVGRDGASESFIATGTPSVVMSKIASQIFGLYQRTKFPSTVKVGAKLLTLVGGLNGSVDRVSSPELAEEACATLEARLPNKFELELLDSYGDWSGGVSLGEKAWAMPKGKVYHPLLRSNPVRNTWEVNDKTFLYYCVR